MKVFLISFLLPVWKSWGNSRSGSGDEKKCRPGKYITEIDPNWQSGYGLVNWWFKCSDGQTQHATDNWAGKTSRNIRCDNGFIAMAGKEEGNYGLVDGYGVCLGTGDWKIARRTCGWALNECGGRWNDMDTCKNGQKITGIQTRTESGKGITNLRYLCN